MVGSKSINELLEGIYHELQRSNDLAMQTLQRDELLTVQEAANLLKITRQTLQRYAKQGKLNKVERAGRTGYLKSDILIIKRIKN